MRVRFQTFPFFIMIACVVLLSGCDVGSSAPHYTADSVLTTMKEFGVTAHYPQQQGKGQLLLHATGERHFLQIDNIDHFSVKDGWAEVYLYPDETTAYEEGLKLRQEFEERIRHDMKIAQLQGKTYERSPLPLLQHGNVILFGPGIASNEAATKRLNESFGNFKYE